jgi:hypothetical protein
VPKRAVPRIFCVEGGWSSSLKDEKSVQPLLEFLERSNKVRHIYQHVRTVDALVDIVEQWPQRQYNSYSLGYFGFHGSGGTLHVGRRRVDLETLGESLAGSCKGKTIYFGSCSVLNIPKRRIEEFRRLTQARAVIGYTTDVDWYASAAFDLVLFEALTHYQRIDAVDRWLRKEYPGLSRKLGFKMVYG